MDKDENEIIDIEPSETPSKTLPKPSMTEEKSPDAPKDASAKPEEPYSVVAGTPKQKKAIIFGGFIIAVLAIYYVTFGRTLSPEELEERRKAEISEKKEEIAKDAKQVSSVIDNIPLSSVPQKVPEPPPISEPTPPEPPPPPAPTAPTLPTLPSGQPGGTAAPTLLSGGAATASSGLPALGQSDAKLSEEQVRAIEQRKKSGIMILSGSSGVKTATGEEEKKDGKEGDKKEATPATPASSTGFLGFGNGSLENTSVANTAAEQVKATKVGNLDLIVAQGKVIDAVLETAINTDLPGMLRAVVARDVYAESGKNILVAKGSRLVGKYDSNITDGQTRVSIIWNRLIRPDGIDIQLDSAGTDGLGRAGVSGKLDSKFWAKLGTAFLVSYIIPVVANKLANVNTKQAVTTTSAPATSTAAPTSSTSSSFEAQQAKEASDKFSEIAQKAIESAFPSKPTITVNQGTRINVFVQKDLVFPYAYSSNSEIFK